MSTVSPIKWQKPVIKRRSSSTMCIVVDKFNNWHDNQMVDLGDRDVKNFSWNYYGTWLPLLVEDQNGELRPFYLSDAVGDSPGRLFKAAHPEGWRATWKHVKSVLQKVLLGLMVAVVLGTFFLIFLLINQ